jgi:hypothetical protein
MGFLRRAFGKKKDNGQGDPTVNPNRTGNLYALTPEGYIIAEDIACQYEYAQEHTACPDCGGQLRVAAQINRASQGLNELVCTCEHCGKRASLLFDVSNEAYQAWIADQLGDLYIRNYEGAPRRPR